MRITQDDVVKRRFLDEEHRSHVPDFGVFIDGEGPKGGKDYRILSRQMVLFCVERRKAWRLLQSKAGVVNVDYQAQKALLEKADRGEIPVDQLLADGRKLLEVERERFLGRAS